MLHGGPPYDRLLVELVEAAEKLTGAVDLDLEARSLGLADGLPSTGVKLVLPDIVKAVVEIKNPILDLLDLEPVARVQPVRVRVMPELYLGGQSTQAGDVRQHRGSFRMADPAICANRTAGCPRFRPGRNHGGPARPELAPGQWQNDALSGRELIEPADVAEAATGQESVAPREGLGDHRAAVGLQDRLPHLARDGTCHRRYAAASHHDISVGHHDISATLVSGESVGTGTVPAASCCSLDEEWRRPAMACLR